MNISIIFPAYNEEKIIGISLKKTITYCKKMKYAYEIIVIDDNSKDSTKSIVSSIKGNIILLENKKNRGKGYCVKKGILAAKKDTILFTDCDLSTPIEEVTKFYTYIKSGYDIVIGSRRIKNARIKTRQPFLRRFAGGLFPFFVSLIVTDNFKDTQCGFKMFKNQIAKEIVSKQTIDGFSFDVEFLFISEKRNFKIKEIPIEWNNNKNSKVNIFSDPFIMLFDLFKIRFNFLMGKYS